MKHLTKYSLLAAVLLSSYAAQAFCGFYVAKADTKLFNKTSQVIMARDGHHTVITMANDYQGPMDDFAMVVPVPQVLQRDQITTVSNLIFEKLDAYSAPRLAEYYDDNPCHVREKYKYYERNMVPTYSWAVEDNEGAIMDSFGVTIEAKYEVGEYDVLILSAEKSAGLETWLLKNGYKIPEKARDVLEPYIKSNMKFFVVKVNAEELEKTGATSLNPIRISFDSEKYMLPIRLGMANANGDQDMIVYHFSKKGRVETTNYRTVAIPTDRDIPLTVQDEFGKFYKDVFEKSYKREYGKTVFLEYAWDVSARNTVKCDPCVGTPPVNQDLVDAGVFWLDNNSSAPVYFTRLHVRYNRENFPQDLSFQQTTNNQRFQGRYVIRHPAVGSLDCSEGQTYLRNLIDRRAKEVQELNRLTGWSTVDYDTYIDEYSSKLKKDKSNKGEVITPVDIDNTTPGGTTPVNWTFIFYALLGACILALVVWPLLKPQAVQ